MRPFSERLEGDFVYIGQGGIGRFDNKKTPANVKGFISTEFRSCKIIIIVGVSKCVLIHFDAAMKASLVEEELKWVAEVKKIVVVRNLVTSQTPEMIKKSFEQFHEDLKKSINNEHLKLVEFKNISSGAPEACVEVTNRSSDNISVKFSYPLKTSHLLTPQECYRISINTLNGFNAVLQPKQALLNDLQFDGRALSKPPALLSIGREAVDFFATKSTVSTPRLPARKDRNALEACLEWARGLEEGLVNSSSGITRIKKAFINGGASKLWGKQIDIINKSAMYYWYFKPFYERYPQHNQVLHRPSIMKLIEESMRRNKIRGKAAVFLNNKSADTDIVVSVGPESVTAMEKLLKENLIEYKVYTYACALFQCVENTFVITKTNDPENQSKIQQSLSR